MNEKKMTQEQARRILSEYLDLDKEEHSEFLDAIRTLIQTIDEINGIINAPVYIQEDVMRYKMICEVMKNE